MGIKRYIASKDTTITNAFKENLVNRAVNSNMGQSDTLEVFSLYGQTLETVNLHSGLMESSGALFLPTFQSSTFLSYFGFEGNSSKTMFEDLVFIPDPQYNSDTADGAMYIFKKQSTNASNAQTWSLEHFLLPPTTASQFGKSFCYDKYNHRLAIGGPEFEEGRGKVFLYSSSSVGGWSLSTTLTGSNEDFFGGAVNIKDDVMIIGSNGSVYIHRKQNNNSWYREQIITSASIGERVVLFNNNSYFAVADTSLNVGAQTLVGVVDIYGSGSSGWVKKKSLFPDPITSSERFGTSLKIYKDKLYIAGSTNFEESPLRRGTIRVYGSGSTDTEWNLLDVIAPPSIITDITGTQYNIKIHAGFCNLQNGMDIDGNKLIVNAGSIVYNDISGSGILIYQSGSSGWEFNKVLTGSTGLVLTPPRDAQIFKHVGIVSSSINEQIYVSRHGLVSEPALQISGFGQIYTHQIIGTDDIKSREKSRILVDFPIEEMRSDRVSGILPAEGNVRFNLKMSNAEHINSLPKQFNIKIQGVSKEWDEGVGLDMETYLDEDTSNWLSASTNDPWETPGGDHFDAQTYTQYFEKGTEDLNIDITSLVEDWINQRKSSNGVSIQIEDENADRSFYTKKFFARGSEFFYKKPWIEAQFDSSRKDNRLSFANSSSLAPAEDNLNKLFIYNRFKGKLVNIPAVGSGSIYVSLYSGSTGPTGSALTLHNGLTSIAGSHVATGIYSATLAVNTTFDYLFDVWHDNAGTQFITGSRIEVLSPVEDSDPAIPQYVMNITNLKPSYSNLEKTRFNLFIRDKNWQPTIYTVAQNSAQGISVEDLYFKIFRIADNIDIIPYGTGSLNHTRLSLDKNGNYFDFSMNILEPGYSYGIKFLFKNSNQYHEQKEVFKFRVDE